MCIMFALWLNFSTHKHVSNRNVYIYVDGCRRANIGAAYLRMAIEVCAISDVFLCARPMCDESSKICGCDLDSANVCSGEEGVCVRMDMLARWSRKPEVQSPSLRVLSHYTLFTTTHSWNYIHTYTCSHIRLWAPHRLSAKRDN